ncbi:MAG: hypothetical protein IJX98_02060 [Clostridia bacterium]|nr:hypothetical protein [Clostridia bacterium]
MVTDRSFSAMEEAQATHITQEFLPEDFLAAVRIVKRVLDEEILRSKIYAYVSEAFPAAAAFLKEEDIKVQMLTSGANFYFDIASGEQSIFTSSKILDSVSAYLSGAYCGSFYGNVRVVEKQRDTSILEEVAESKEETFVEETRTFHIENFKKLDGAETIPKEAVYIADIAGVEGVFAVCGQIIFLEEKHYIKHNEQTGEDMEKTRFSVTISDGTGMLRTTYFPKKLTVDKVRELKQGDTIVIIGSMEEYNGNLSFKAGKINYGNPPEDFTPIAKASKPVPKFYHAVTPEPYVDYTQAGFFDNLTKPEALKNRVFVVFDLETTGLVHNPAMGKMDKIIEIGAVKLVNGEITEKFASFVACKERLPAKIVELTGIHDEDLCGAPEVDQVLADFFKFADGAVLVGHNVGFDYAFVKFYGGENGFVFSNPSLDTVVLSQEVLKAEGLPNYKLNTVAEYFGFEFNHHRAFEDAATTAKIFIELIRRRGKLPL